VIANLGWSLPVSDTQNTSESPKPHKKSVLLGGGREALVILVLLVFLSRVGPQVRPLLLLITLALAVYWYVRFFFRFGKKAGIAAVTALGVGCVSVVLFQYNCHVTNEAFLKTLDAYDTVTIQRQTIFPSSPIYQVSLKAQITDDDLIQIASMRELRNVTDVYLKNCRATDRSLNTVEQWAGLTYVFIESEIITDEAIIDFERRHPDCRVIPYGRNW
jgi:hypothetical protein